MSFFYDYLSNVGVVDPALSWCTGIMLVLIVFLGLRAVALIWK